MDRDQMFKLPADVNAARKVSLYIYIYIYFLPYSQKNIVQKRTRRVSQTGKGGGLSPQAGE